MITICVFGDSIVRSCKQPENKKWVGKLRYFLWKIYEVNTVYDLGIDGETIERLLKRFETECRAREPNIIIINIGINDSQYNSQKNSFRVSFRKFKKNLDYLIAKGKNFTPKIIIIGLLPIDESSARPFLRGLHRYYTNKDRKKYNEGVKLAAEENNILFIDLFESWIKINYKKLLTSDGIHPNSKGHQKIFEKVKEVLVKNKLI